MLELGRISIETKGWRPQSWYLDNPCEPEQGWSEYAKVCP